MYWYRLAGLRFESQLPLVELGPALTPAPGETADIRIVVGPVTPPQTGLTAPGTTRWISQPKRHVVEIADVGRFEVNDGKQICIERTGSDEYLLRLYLLGSVLGALWHQRGQLPLHAGAVVLKESAWAFVGHSGAGKSSLVTALATSSGASYLCDDVCVLDISASGAALAWPGLSRVRASPELCALLKLDNLARLASQDPQGKLALVPPWPRPVAALPLAGVIVLETGADEVPTLDRLSVSAALTAALEHTYRREYLSGEVRVRHFEQCAALARQVPFYRLRRRWGLDYLRADTARIAQLLTRCQRFAEAPDSLSGDRETD